MKLKGKTQTLAIIMVTTALFAAGCAMLISQWVIITGRVELLDSTGGNGGVLVHTDAAATYTDDKGRFSLKGHTAGGDCQVVIYFEKEGYQSRSKSVHIPWKGDDKNYSEKYEVVVDIGVIKLHKVK